MDYKLELARVLAHEPLTAEEIYPLITQQDGKLADIALPCHKFAAKLKKSPVAVADDFKKRIEQNKPKWLGRAECVNGYFNIFLDRTYFSAQVVSSVLAKGFDWADKPQNNKTITVDYSSINIAKPFHIGHLLTTVIGGSLCRIFKFLGYKVVGINHLGDWGTQFGKLIAACKKWGGGDTLEELNKLYVRFHAEAETDKSLDDTAREWFRKIEEGDSEAMSLFHKFKDITLAEANSVYDLLGIKFDSYNGESFYNDKMQPVVDLLESRGLLTESEGAKVVDLSEYDMPPCLILKSDGASLYATRDLAAAIYRKSTYGFDRNLYVVAYQQNLHFKQVFKVLELLGFDWAEDCIHVPFGMVSLEGLGALSTRKGNVVLLKDVLTAAVDKTLEIIDSKNPELPDKKKTATEVGVGAVIFGALANSRIKDMVFSLDKALNFDGETGPYLQYTHARCCSVLGKGDEPGVFDSGANSGAQLDKAKDIDFSVLTDDETFDVVRLLGAFDGVVQEAADRYEPSLISRYLIDLCQSFNRFYIGHRVVGEDKTVMYARLRLTECVRNTLKNGLGLILLSAPQKM